MTSFIYRLLIYQTQKPLTQNKKRSTKQSKQSNQNKQSNNPLAHYRSRALGALLRAYLLQGSPDSKELGYKAFQLTDDQKCKLQGEEIHLERQDS